VAGSPEVAARLDELANDDSQRSQEWDREHDQHIVAQLLKSIAADFEPKTLQAFGAFVLEGRPADEVAAAVGISAGAVWTAESHVLRRLRQVTDGLLD
jgi:RNA polymerase sigma-70 factor (ECF subfamily)